MLSHRSFPSKIYVCVPLLVGICVSLSYGAGAHTNSNATHPSEHTQIQVSHTQIHCMPRICVCATVLMWNSCDTFLWDTSLSILQLPTIFHSFLKCFCTRCESLKGWRTMLVIPELEHEVKLLSESKSTRKVWIAQLLVKKLIPNMRSYINWAEAMTFRSSLSVYLNFANSAWDQHLHDPTQNFMLNMTKKVSATCSYCFHYLLLFILTNLDILG